LKKVLELNPQSTIGREKRRGVLIKLKKKEQKIKSQIHLEEKSNEKQDH
jgi:hypothetical protein